MRRIVLAGFAGVVALSIGRVQAQKPPAGQWPNYQHNSNFSPLTQITPENVSRLTKAWAFNYGAGTVDNVPFVSLDYRLPVKRRSPDDENWPTQPIPVKTPPTGRLGMTRADINNVVIAAAGGGP